MRRPINSSAAPSILQAIQQSERETAERGAPALAARLEDWRQQLTTFAKEVSQELDDIEGILTTERRIASEPPTTRSPQPASTDCVTPESQSTDAIDSEDVPTVTVAPSLELSHGNSESSLFETIAEDQDRLSALKARLADRLRSHSDAGESGSTAEAVQ